MEQDYVEYSAGETQKEEDGDGLQGSSSSWCIPHNCETGLSAAVLASDR